MSLQKNLSYYAGDRDEMLKFIPDSAQKILDIGCGQGRFGVQLVNRNMEVWGIEPFPEAASMAKQVLSEVITGKIEDVIDQIPQNYFDIIVLNDVLEHLIDPWDIIAKLRYKINSKGKVVASIPNFRYITNIFDLIVKRDIQYCESGILDSTHLRFFTRKSMIRLFSSSGYSVEYTEGIYITKSFLGFSLATLINLFSFSYHRDIYYKEYVIIASRIL